MSKKQKTIIKKALIQLHYLKMKLGVIINYPIDFFKSDRIIVFHHIPKCGGMSVHLVLNKWFIVVKDYFILPNNKGLTIDLYKKNKQNLNKLKNIHCLSGHYSDAEEYLFERYPEIVNNSKFYIFTLIREPLKVKISYYYYLVNLGLIDIQKKTLINFLMEEPNYLARKMNITEENYLTVLQMYNFIGIIDNAQDAVDKLSEIFKRKKIKLPKVNTSKKDKQQDLLSDDFIIKFKMKNLLDYKIYNYVKSRQ